METETRYALGVQVVVIVYTMIEHFLGFNSANHAVGQYTRLAGVLFPLVAIFLGMRAKRREQEPGSAFTFGRGLRTGFLTAAILSLLSALWFLFYGNVVNPDFLPTLLEFERDRMIASGADPAGVAAAIDRLRTMYSYPVQPVVQTVLGIVYGTFFAAVIALLMRRKGSTAASAPSPPGR